MKRTIASIVVAVLLLLMSTASASTAGTATDPLITLNYLNGIFADELYAETSDILSTAAADAMNRLNELSVKYLSYRFVPRSTRITLAAGDTVVLAAGGSYILYSGSASLAFARGVVINLSTGQEVGEGEPLATNQRYFCAEDTFAVIMADSPVIGFVDGFCFTDNGLLNRPHYVFLDVMEDDWYYAAVEFVYKNGIYNGTSVNTFSPNDEMTRGMLVTTLYNIEKRPPAGEGGQFTDVRDASTYYYDAVTWASENGIIQGYSDGSFKPDDSITREQMATLFYQYAAYKQLDTVVPGADYEAFPDKENVSDYAVDAFKWAVSHHIVNGSDGKLLPQDTATRAEAAQIVKNYLGAF